MKLTIAKHIIKEQLNRLKRTPQRGNKVEKEGTNNTVMSNIQYNFGTPSSKDDAVRIYNQWYNTCVVDGGTLPPPPEFNSNINALKVVGGRGNAQKAIPWLLIGIGLAAAGAGALHSWWGNDGCDGESGSGW